MFASFFYEYTDFLVECGVKRGGMQFFEYIYVVVIGYACKIGFMSENFGLCAFGVSLCVICGGVLSKNAKRKKLTLNVSFLSPKGCAVCFVLDVMINHFLKQIVIEWLVPWELD